MSPDVRTLAIASSALAFLLLPRKNYHEWKLLPPWQKGRRQDDEGDLHTLSSQSSQPREKARWPLTTAERKEMTPEVRRSDPRWQTEHKIAELTGEQKVLGFEIQQRTARLYQVTKDIELLQSELSRYGETS